MRLTTKGRYAVNAMLDLALHTDEAPVNLADVAERQAISLTYLEQLFAKLRRKGLVTSVRGPGGGFRLAMDADEITAARVIYAIEEPIDATRCGGRQNCMGHERCLTHDLWMGLSRHVADYLNGTTLGALVRMNNVQRVADRQSQSMYQRRQAVSVETR